MRQGLRHRRARRGGEDTALARDACGRRTRALAPTDAHGAQVRLRFADGADMHREPRRGEGARHHHRTARTLAAAERQRTRQHPLQRGIIACRNGAEESALVQEPVALAQPLPGEVVGRHDPPVQVQLDDPASRVLEQRGERRAERPGVDQRLPDPHELSDVRQETRHHLDLRGRPALAADGVRSHPDDARALRPVETHVQAVAGIGAEQGVVPGRRGLLLLFGVERGGMHHPAVRQVPEARDALVEGMEDLEILALPFRVELAAIAEAGEEDVDPVRGSPVA